MARCLIPYFRDISQHMALELTVKLVKLLEQWETTSPRPTGEKLVSLLTKVAETFEVATELYLKKDPDPFDGRHPSRAHPDSALGHMLKKVFKNQEFINSVIHDYLSSSANQDVQTVACRILLDLLPGIDPQIFRDNERLLTNLILYTERSPNPLQSYSLGVLAVAMDDEDIAVNFKEQNTCLVPVMLERLEDLSSQYFKIQHSPVKECTSTERPFAHLNKESKDAVVAGCSNDPPCVIPEFKKNEESNFVPPVPPVSAASGKNALSVNEYSNSSWSDMETLMIGDYQVYPLTLANEQRYILQYLTSVGVYQELQASIFEDPAKVLNLLIRYIDLKQHSNVRLAFDALRYLGILLCHKKCAVEFISKIGVQHLLHVHRPSLAATGVSFVLYYLANNEDAMQKICLLPRTVVTDVVRYALWLLECSHSSGRAHATMFFEYTFHFEIIRHLFDEQDGLRKLLNTVSTLDIVVRNITRIVPGMLTQDVVVTSRHVCRHAILALKRYFEAHADAKASALRRSQPTCSSRSTAYKKTLEENVETLVALMPSPVNWEPVDQLRKLDGIHFLLKLIVMHHEWTYSGKMETVRNALDILYVCSVSDRVKLSLCDTVQYVTPTQDVAKRIGMSIILQCAMGEKLPDCDVRRAALNIIVNCVAGPVITEAQVVPDSVHAGVKMKSTRSNEDVLNRVWNCVRSTNGIMILRMLLTTKSPVMGADAIRALACQALCGLARSEKVMQILSKLQLFTSGQLQVLMREPILRDKRSEHAKFVKHCTKLIEMVAGGTSVHSQLANISKAEIVAQTVITYDQRQLLQLIAEHLQEKGLFQSASTLLEEAKLELQAPKPCLSSSYMTSTVYVENSGVSRENSEVSHSNVGASLFPSPTSYEVSSIVKADCTNSNVLGYSPVERANCSDLSIPKPGPSAFSSVSSTGHQLLLHDNVCTSLTGKRTQASLVPSEKSPDGPTSVKKTIVECQESVCVCSSLSGLSCSSFPEVHNGFPVETKSSFSQSSSSAVEHNSHLFATPLRRILSPKSRKSSCSVQKQTATRATSSSSAIPTTYSRSLFLRKQAMLQQPLHVVRHPLNLDSIVSEYLRNQHALCKTPYVTCPPFDLFTPHQCPEPRYQNVAPSNIALRYMQKQFTPSYWGHCGSSMTRKYMSSRFRDLNSFLDPYGNTMTQCAFASLEDKIYIGTFTGEIRVYETLTGNEIHGFNCHETEVTNIQALKNSNLFMTSAQWRRPVTALWNAAQNYQLVYIFQDECYAEFSKLTQDRIIATKYERAQIYDLQTGQLITTLNHSNLGNSYRLNRATFNHTDELVLSDGIIWNVNSQKPIHKLDKFNPRINGVFHPNGLEILSNSEVWDMRTYRLLRTVPELEQSKLIFDQTGDVIYSAILAPEIDHDNSCFKRYGSSFRAFDGADYTCITTRDVQKGINDIAVNPDDKYLCVIQSPLNEPLFGGSESKCHVYEIGRGYEDDDNMDGLTDEEEDTQLQMSDEDEDDDDDDDDDEDDDQDDDDDDQDDAQDENENVVEGGNGMEDDQNSNASYNVSDDELYFSFRA